MKSRNISWRSIAHICLKILSWAIFIILVFIAIFLLYYYIANKIYISKGSGYEPKFSIYIIASGSMVPAINVADAVINIKVDSPDDLEVGDVITFRSSSPTTMGITVTHRIKGITTDDDGNICYITKGDANNVEDSACAKYTNIIGKVVLRIPGLGYIQKFLASGFGWLLFILIPALIIIIRDILKISRLAAIKNDVSKIGDKKKDSKKIATEKKRKEEIKRNLLKENDGNNKYFEEPTIQIVEKTKKNKKKK